MQLYFSGYRGFGDFFNSTYLRDRNYFQAKTLTRLEDDKTSYYCCGNDSFIELRLDFALLGKYAGVRLRKFFADDFS